MNTSSFPFFKHWCETSFFSQSAAKMMKKALLKSAPPDKYYLVYIIFALQGIGQLFPFNVFITASAYFTPRLCGSSFESTYLIWINVVANIASTAGMALSIRGQFWCGQRTRFVLPLSINFLLFAATTGIVMVPQGEMNPNFFFVLTMLTVVATCVTTSFVSAAAFGLSGLFPGLYAQAIMSGQGIAGVVVSLAAILSLMSTPEGGGANECDYTDFVKYSSLAYFGFSAVVLMLCLISYFWLERIQFARHFVPAFRDDDSYLRFSIEESNHADLPDEDEVFAVGSVVVSGRSFTKSRSITSSVNTKSLHAERTRRALVAAPPVLPIARKAGSLLAATFSTFTITLLIFPAVTGSIVSSRRMDTTVSRLFRDSNVFVSFGFLLFNIFDTVGRSMAGIDKLSTALPRRLLFPISLLRGGFLVLLLLCCIPGKIHWLPTPFSNDYIGWLIVAVFAWSNGFISSVAIMQASSVVSPNEAETATTLLAFAITFGCTVGASLAFVIQAVFLPDV